MDDEFKQNMLQHEDGHKERPCLYIENNDLQGEVRKSYADYGKWKEWL